eukprot:1161544-Pelagomonas_calceolata.AAC.5
MQLGHYQPAYPVLSCRGFPGSETLCNLLTLHVAPSMLQCPACPSVKPVAFPLGCGAVTDGHTLVQSRANRDLAQWCVMCARRIAQHAHTGRKSNAAHAQAEDTVVSTATMPGICNSGKPTNVHERRETKLVPWTMP